MKGARDAVNVAHDAMRQRPPKKRVGWRTILKVRQPVVGFGKSKNTHQYGYMPQHALMDPALLCCNDRTSLPVASG